MTATLYVICGMAGAGKTTFAQRLEKNTGAIRLAPDEWITRLIGSKGDRLERERLRDPVEDLQWTTAQQLLRRGVSVILENGFWSREERFRLIAMTKELGGSVVLHFLDTPKPELLRRLQVRNAQEPHDSLRVTVEDLDLWLSWFEPPELSELELYDSFQIHRP